MLKLFKRLQHSIFPCHCVCCGKPTGFEIEVCDKCEQHLYYNTGKVCKGCARHISKCECRKMNRLFEGLSAPFEYKDSARKMILRAKNCRDYDAIRFIAKKMVRATFNVFPDIRFDCVCYVPSQDNETNQSRMIAEYFSKQTSINLEHLLLQTGKKEPQHNQPYSMRKHNVAGIYTPAGDIKDKQILLIDDICTTGATLNECTAQLLSKGAKSVHCCVGAISEYKKRDDNE